MKKEELSIYRQVAKSALMSWNGLSEVDAEKKVQTETFEELENQVWATGSLNYAVEAIAEIYQSKKMAEKLAEVVLDKENITRTNDQNDFLSIMQAKTSTFGKKEILFVLSEIHDGWVKDNAKKFNQEGREAKRYQHLPFELIGWKEAKADLLFLTPIVKAITGKEINDESLEGTYGGHVSTYLLKKGIDDKSKLVSKIMEGERFYAPLTETNTAQNEVVAVAMVDKVLEMNKSVGLAFKSNVAER